MQNFEKQNIAISLCQKCSREISFGNPYYSIVRSLEIKSFNTENSEEEIEIIESEEITILCKVCGNYFNMESLNTILKHLPIPGQELRN